MAKRTGIAILTAVIFCLLISEARAGDVENLKAEDALLVKRIQGYQQLVLRANIRRAEIQGILKWLAQKEAEIEAEKVKEIEVDSGGSPEIEEKAQAEEKIENE